MKKISVIIPVYKTEKTLDECMQSVLNQSWPDVEVILVDDDSPDQSPALCDRYAAEYENVSVIHQKNQGSAGARNTGLAAAKGTWITFVDSDDCLDGPEALRVMAEKAMEKKADIVVGSFRRFYENESGEQQESVKRKRQVTEINHHHLKEGSYTRTPDFRFKGFYMYGHLAYNWGKLYRREFLMEHELWVPLVPFTQDKAHNIACCAYEPVYAFVDESVYLYRENEESVTHRYKKNMMPVWISIAVNFQEFLNKRHITKPYGDLIAFHLFFGAFYLVQQELSREKKRSGAEGHTGGIRAAAKVLKEYGKEPIVRKSFKELACGKYVDAIEPVSWKLVIRGAAILFSLHGYTLMALSIACLCLLGTDKKITRRRYRAAKIQAGKTIRTEKKGAGEVRIAKSRPQQENPHAREALLSKEERRLLELLRDALRGNPEYAAYDIADAAANRADGIANAVSAQTDAPEETVADSGEKPERACSDRKDSGTEKNARGWSGTIEIAQKHAVLPLLYESFGKRGQTAARSTVLQSYHLLFMTKYVVKLLEEHQIPVVVLKGVSAAADYPVPELRKSGDVDLLFTGKGKNGYGHVPSRPEAEKIMKEAGFLLADEQHANHHIAFTGPDGIHVELHYQAAEEFAYPGINEGMSHWMEQCDKHCVRREIMGVSLPVFDRPYQAVQLLLHMFQHFVYAGFGLKLLCDWVVLLRGPWTEEERHLLLRTIEECHLGRFAQIITGVCVSYLGLERECAEFLLLPGKSKTMRQAAGEDTDSISAVQSVPQEELELFLREVFDAEEFGNSEQTRMVMMKGARPADYVREFHHQMHLNYPQKGKNPLLWPALWILTFVRFVSNNRSLRHVPTISVLKKARERSRRMERLHLFDE